MGNVLQNTGGNTLKALAGGGYGSVGDAVALSYSSIDYPPIPTVEIATSLQRYVDATGSDSNDGQLVANGGTGPWATFEKGVDELAASSTWLWLNLRGAITVSSSFDTTGVGTGSGTAGTPAVVRGDPTTNDAVLNMSTFALISGQENWLWHSFTMACTNSAGIAVGTNANTKRHTFRNITATMTGTGGDNVAPIKCAGVDANYFGVLDCDITGPGTVGSGVNANTACIYLRQVPNFRIENNIIDNAPRPIYYKHANLAANDPTDGYIRNNWVKNTAASASFLACRGSEISNNIFASELKMTNQGGGEAPENCTIAHNTFMQGFQIKHGVNNSGTTDGSTTAFKLINSIKAFTGTVYVGDLVHNTTDDTTALVTAIDSDTQLTLDTDIMATGESYTVGASINGMVTNDNIFDSGYAIDYYGDSAYANTCTSDYNLFAGNINFQGTTGMSLATWQSTSVPSSQDTNSISGSPTFTGGATPTTIAGYALASGNGINAASDGANMGADVTIVGVLT